MVYNVFVGWESDRNELNVFNSVKHVGSAL